MIIPVKPDANGNIDIFYEGDENVTQVYFENPDSDFKWALHYLRRGDKRPYNVPLEEADGDLIWTASLADTEKPGTGFAQLVGSAEGQTKHSRPYTVTVRKSLGKPGSVPAAEKAFGDAVAADAASAKRAAEDAEKIYRYVKQGLEDGSFIGPAGPQGPRGEKGEQGVPGAQGEKGDQGPAGPAGADGKDGLDAPQIDDGTISRDNPWSSQMIVETLCPPIAESGNPVTCYPVAGYPLGVVARWEPTQAGEGDPSPENIRPISGRDSVKVERCGENLLQIAPFDTDVYKGVTFEYVPDGGVRIQGTASANVDSPTFPIRHLSPGKYYGLDMGTGIAASIVVQRAGKMLWLNAKGTFEIIKGDIVKYWYMIVNTGYTANKTVYPYIVPGTTAPTSYAPYKGDALNLQLPETVYGGSVDAVSGQGQNAWKLLTLDGDEAWNTWGVNAYNPTATGFYTYDISDYDVQSIAAVCSNLPLTPNVWGGREVGVGFATDGNSRYFIYSVPSVILDDISDNAHAIASLKSYLAAQAAAGTPVQIAYKLAEPVPFQATGAQPIMPLEGETNTIMTDADSVTVTGRADPAHAIAALQAQLAVATQQLAETEQAMLDTTAMAVDYIYEQDSQIIGGDDSDNQTDSGAADVPGV